MKYTHVVPPCFADFSQSQPQKLRHKDGLWLQPDALTGVPVAGLALFVLRPRSSGTIFATLYPARFHLPGLSERTNANRYSFPHRQFEYASILAQTKPDVKPFFGKKLHNFFARPFSDAPKRRACQQKEMGDAQLAITRKKRRMHEKKRVAGSQPPGGRSGTKQKRQPIRKGQAAIFIFCQTDRAITCSRSRWDPSASSGRTRPCRTSRGCRTCR